MLSQLLAVSATLPTDAAPAHLVVDALSGAAEVQSPPTSHSPPHPHDAAAAQTVAPNFVGLSIEVPSVMGMIGTADAPRHSLAQALKNLAALTPGPHAGPILRLGGNSADSSCWHTASSGGHCVAKRGGVTKSVPCCSYNITDRDLQAYSAFAKIAPNTSFVIGELNPGLAHGVPKIVWLYESWSTARAFPSLG